MKSESDANPDQLRRYRSHLTESGVEATFLALLTRYPVIVLEPDCQPDLYLRWHQVAEWIDQERQRYAFKPVSTYLVDQLIGFFGYRNMTMGQVTWELAGGVRSLRMLTDMLFEAASACGVKAQFAATADKIGLRLNKNRYWVGLRFDQPEVLVLATDFAKVDPEKAAKVAIGEVYEWRSEPGFGHRIKVDLNSEDVHFFARSKASQVQFLEEFLKEGLDVIRPLETEAKTIRSDAPEAEQNDAI